MLWCGLVLLFWPARALRGDNFVFYFPSSRQLVPVEVIGNSKYLPLLQVLNLVGKLNGLQEKRNTLKVAFGKSHLEFHADDEEVRVDKKTMVLSAPVRVSDGRWMVPTDFVTSVVPDIVSVGVEYQAGANRIFLGDIMPGSFSVRLAPLSGGARLTFRFTEKVTVRTVSVNGKWIMYLGDHPIEPLEPSFRFQNPYVAEAQFDDQDGWPKLVITPSTAGLNFYSTLVEGGKVLLADVVKPSAPQAKAPPPPPPPAAAVSGPPPATPAPKASAAAAAPAAAPGPPLPIVALDAGHGGDDAGARSRDGLAEKDLAAQLVSRVRSALLSSGKYRVVLTRAGDINATFEQRTVAANVAGAVLFLSFHAGNLGGNSPRVALYTYQPPSPAAPPAGDEAKPGLTAWDQIQEAYLERSRQLAQNLMQRFTQISGLSVDAPTAAPLRVLRSVNSPAVAIEVGSLTLESDAGALASAAFQEELSAAVAEVLAVLPGGGGEATR